MTNWRTATTPTGPMAGKAVAPTAAPVWLAAELASIMATPAPRWRAVAVVADSPTADPVLLRPGVSTVAIPAPYGPLDG
ncbi:hypothetical protein GCM10027445_35910 [Amycolatopsis endophytica]